MQQEVKTTPLHDWHLASGANMANFGSYDMPLWYPSGAKGEHLAVLTGAGIFDTSHMAVVTVGGKDARALLQHCFSKDLAACLGLAKGPLVAGRCVYGLFLNKTGEVIDDAIVSQVEDAFYMVVVNAGMGGEIAAHLEKNRGDLDATVTDLTDKVAKMDIQGPAAAKVMAKLLKDPESVFGKMPYFSFKGYFDGNLAKSQEVLLADGTPVMLSRTGYTGEFGFEIFLDPSKIVKLWEDMLAVGGEHGVIACGLAARDSLRAGAVLPLSHQDVGPWPFANNPWPFAVAWNDDGSGFTKTFIGSEALLAVSGADHTLAFAGYDLRKIPVGEGTFVTDLSGEKIGRVLTCASDMGIGRVGDKIVSIGTPEDMGKPEGFKPRGLCCGFVKVTKKLPEGEEVILTDGKRKIKVEIRADVRPDRTARRPVREMV